MALVINQARATVELTSTGYYQAFGFNATYLRVANRSAGVVYINLASTAATTADYQLESSGVLPAGNILTPSIAMISTSTAAGGFAVTLIALGP